ncbi:NmrA-like family-domain-containing protein [Lipomyces starkeyi]
MSKLIVIVGATGGQGGSVVSAFLKDKNFKIRGITRNPDGETAKGLIAKGVEMVRADLNDGVTLVKAFEGAYAIYAVTDFFEPFGKMDAEAAAEVEYQQGVNLALAASKTAGLQHYLWSTLPYSNKLSQGKLTVPHFDGKARVDEFIKKDTQLLSKTTFLYYTFYASNMFFPTYNPIFIKKAGKYILLNPGNPEKTPIASLGDHRTNVGVFARSVLTNPPKVGGTYVKCSVEDFPSLNAYFAKWCSGSGRVTSSQSTYVLQVSFEQYKDLWPKLGDELGIMMMFWELLGENSWNALPGNKMVHAYELMTETAKKELVTTEEAFKALDWAPIF